MKILEIESLEILDSRGNPTLQVTVILEDGSKGEFAVPSGASTGIHEAHEKRDGNKNVYHGKSVHSCVENIGIIKEDLFNIDFTQKSFDKMLLEIDGSINKEVLGANTILGLSIAFAKACAKHYALPLYEYLFRLHQNLSFKAKKHNNYQSPNLFANVINGGLHSGNALNIQEFMIIPLSENLPDKVRAVSEIYQTLKIIIEEKFGKDNTAVGDEGGFAPSISKATEALDLLVEAIEKTNYTSLVVLAFDAAASSFYDSKTKKYQVEEGLFLNYKELVDFYLDLMKKYPIVSIEDPFFEDDFEGFNYFLKKSNKEKVPTLFNDKGNLLVVGDDLLVTNPSRILLAHQKNACNSLLLKINQIGTLTESLEAYSLASKKGWHTIVSHRSGETTDSFIADLSVALSSSIKLGAPARGERVAKYNRLLEIFK